MYLTWHAKYGILIGIEVFLITVMYCTFIKINAIYYNYLLSLLTGMMVSIQLG